MEQRVALVPHRSRFQGLIMSAGFCQVYEVLDIFFSVCVIFFLSKPVFALFSKNMLLSV